MKIVESAHEEMGSLGVIRELQIGLHLNSVDFL